MEEKEIIDGGEQAPMDNSDVNNETPISDNSQDDGGDKDTLENLQKRYSDSSREAKRITQVHKSYRQVLKDNSYLLELDKGVAEDVVKQLYEDGYSNTDSYEELIKGLRGDTTKKSEQPINSEEIAKKVRADILAEQQEEEALDIIDKALSKFDEDTQKLYTDELEEVLGDRKLTPAFAKKELDKIIFYHNKEQIEKDRDDDALSNLASNGVGKLKGATSTTMTKSKLDELGIPAKEQQRLYPELFPKN